MSFTKPGVTTKRILNYLFLLVVTCCIVGTATLLFTPIRLSLFTHANQDLKIELKNSSLYELDKGINAFFNAHFDPAYFYKMDINIPDILLCFDYKCTNLEGPSKYIAGESLTFLQHQLKRVYDNGISIDKVNELFPPEIKRSIDQAYLKGNPCTITIQKLGRKIAFRKGDKNVVVIINDTMQLQESYKVLLLISSTNCELDSEQPAISSQKGKVEYFHPRLSELDNTKFLIKQGDDSIKKLVAGIVEYGWCEWVVRPVTAGRQNLLLQLYKKQQKGLYKSYQTIELIPVYVQSNRFYLSKDDIKWLIAYLTPIILWIIKLYILRKRRSQSLRFQKEPAKHQVPEGVPE